MARTKAGQAVKKVVAKVAPKKPRVSKIPQRFKVEVSSVYGYVSTVESNDKKLKAGLIDFEIPKWAVIDSQYDWEDMVMGNKSEAERLAKRLNKLAKDHPDSFQKPELPSYRW